MDRYSDFLLSVNTFIRLMPQYINHAYALISVEFPFKSVLIIKKYKACLIYGIDFSYYFRSYHITETIRIRNMSTLSEKERTTQIVLLQHA